SDMPFFLQHLEAASKAAKIPSKLTQILAKFYASYKEAVTKKGHTIEEYEPILMEFLTLVLKQLETPYSFEPYHERIREPIDYYRFGVDLLRPLVIFESSKCQGIETLNKMIAQLKLGDNIIFFANHQTEPDPQAISLLLENNHPKFAEEMIFVAGH